MHCVVLMYFPSVLCWMSIYEYLIYNKSSAVAEMGNHLATIDMGQKWGGADVALSVGGAVSPFNSVAWAEAYLHPAVWPQYTNVTDRQDRQTVQHVLDGGPVQRSRIIGRTVTVTVTQKLVPEISEEHFGNQGWLNSSGSSSSNAV